MDRDLDFFELMPHVWAQKGKFFAVVMATVLLAVAYLLLAKPVYEVSATLGQPSAAALDSARVVADIALSSESRDRVITQKKAFDAFLAQLQSRHTLQNVHATIDDESLTLEEFERIVMLELPRPGVGKHAAELHFQHTDPALCLAVVNALIEQANRDAANDLAQLVRGEVIAQVGLIEARLRQATSLGQQAGTTGQPPEHLTYIQGLVTDLQLQLSELQPYTDLNARELKLYTLEVALQTPSEPVKPHKPLILAFSLIVGSVLGVLLTMLLGTIEYRRNSQG